MYSPAYDTSLETEALHEWNADELELGLAELNEQEISELFEQHFSDEPQF